MRKHWTALCLGLLGLLVATLSVAEIHHSRINSLDANGRWVSIKAQLGRTLEKSCRFTRTSVSLARNRLDLGAYFAYQELVYHRALPLDQLDLRFQLTPGALLGVLLQHHERGSEGLIIQAAPATQGQLYSADAEGGFARFEPVPGLAALPGRWHRLRLSFEGSQVAIRLDGRDLGSLEIDAAPERRIGFRSTAHTAYVDDVRLRGSFPGGELYEGFHGAQGSWRGWLLALAAGLAAWALLAGLFVRGARRGRRAAWLSVPLYLAGAVGLVAWLGVLPLHVGPSWPMANQLTQRIDLVMAMFNIGFAVLAAACCMVLAYAGSRARFTDRYGLQVALLGLALGVTALPAAAEQLVYLSATYPWYEFTEGQGESCMKLDTRGHLQAIADRYHRQRPPGTRRVLFLGGSTTWGSGASSESQAWVARVERALRQRTSLDGSRYQCVNAGICAQGSPMLVPQFENDWIQLDPFLVVASMSVNDHRVDLFRDNLTRLIQLCEQRDIRLVFSLEPGARVGAPDKTLDMHEVMRSLAQEHGIALVDATDIADQEARGGWVWWDPVHLTDFGNRLYAQGVLPAILEQVEAEERASLRAAEEPP